MNASATSMILPREHASILCVPPREAIPERIAQNRTALNDSPADVCGMPLSQLRAWSRETLLREAVRYTNWLLGDEVTLNVANVSASAPLIVTGHQPELFHAGVWSKNVAASVWARACGGVALNLIVDSDLVGSSSLRVPMGAADHPVVESIPFDVRQPAGPWEEAVVQDASVFVGFGGRVGSAIDQAWSYQPLISESWSAANRMLDRSSCLRDALAASRRQVERTYGIENLELPISLVCESSPFRRFAAQLLTQAERFRSAYNESVADFRLSHRIRSRNHPVPDLEADAEWMEVPFWVWGKGETRRERPFVRRGDSGFELRTTRRTIAKWEASGEHALDATMAMLAELSQRGIRFRTRALTTTLFARVFLADLFIHGIGGAKYDAMTDRLCESFLQIKPPPFATVSATFHLPIGKGSAADRHQEQRLLRLQRDLKYNPDRHIVPQWGTPESDLVSSKQNLIAALKGRRPTAMETRRIEQLNALLIPYAEETSSECVKELNSVRRGMAVNAILRDREFAWCLHPKSGFCEKLLKAFSIPNSVDATSQEQL